LHYYIVMWLYYYDVILSDINCRLYYEFNFWMKCYFKKRLVTQAAEAEEIIDWIYLLNLTFY